MDGGEVTEGTVEKPSSISEELDKLCAYYMSIGVPCEDFWHGDYTYLKHYVEAHKNKIEQRNQELWLQGLYFYNAVATALNNSFSKHTKQYMDKPIDLFPKPKKVEETRQAVIDMLTNWQTAFNKRGDSNGRRLNH